MSSTPPQDPQPSEQPVDHSGQVGNFSLPWSDKNEYGDRKRAARNPELEALIQAQGRNGRNPYGFRRDAPIRAAGKARNNPYLNAFLGLLFICLGAYIFFGLGDHSPLGWIMLAIGVGGIGIIVQNLTRAPSWHRARKVAKAYIAEHGGELPEELDLLS